MLPVINRLLPISKVKNLVKGRTEKLHQFSIYQQMLADYFEIPKEQALNKADDFELRVKKQFKKEPGQMRLLIVVDKLLTGFDAPSATYLYIDKSMRDHVCFRLFVGLIAWMVKTKSMAISSITRICSTV